MRFHNGWLVVLFPLFVLFVTVSRAETKPPKRAPLQICVVQPNTNRLVHLANVKILTPDSDQRIVCQGRTGMTGSPFLVIQNDMMKPSNSLRVMVSKSGVQASARLVYDPSDGCWVPEFDYQFDEVRKTWRKIRRYQYDKDTNQWSRVVKRSSSEAKWGLLPMNVMLPRQIVLPTWQEVEANGMCRPSCCR